MSCLSSIGMMRAGVAAPATLALGLPSLAGPVGVKHNKKPGIQRQLAIASSEVGRQCPKRPRQACTAGLATLLRDSVQPHLTREEGSQQGRTGRLHFLPSPGQGSRAEARSLSPGPPAGGCSPVPSLCGPHTEGLAGPGSAPCAQAATLPGDKCRNTLGKLYVTIHSPRAAADNRGSAKTPCSLHT